MSPSLGTLWGFSRLQLCHQRPLGLEGDCGCWREGKEVISVISWLKKLTGVCLSKKETLLFLCLFVTGRAGEKAPVPHLAGDGDGTYYPRGR